jgi:hypothetical protein
VVTDFDPLPSPGVFQDIGSVGIPGSVSYASGSGSFTVNGSGSNIWGTADEFHYVYQPMSGDGEIVARGVSIQNTDPVAMAGIMIRENLTPGSRHAMVVITPSSKPVFRRRLSNDGTTLTTNVTGAAPRWLRLVRSGSTFTASHSADGTSWVQIGTATIDLPSDVYVGLLTSSHNNATLATGVLDNVTITPLIP